MPVGQQDWSSSGQSPTVSTTFDVGELAARLGSSVNYDRSGRLLMADTFQALNGMWVKTTSGVIIDPIIDYTYWEYDFSSLETLIDVGASNNFSLTRHLRTWQDSKLSLEMAFYYDHPPANVYITFGQILDQVQYVGQIRFTNSMQECQLTTGNAGTVTLFSAASFIFGTGRFATLKYDINMANLYQRLLRIDDKSYDLSAYTLGSSALGLPNETFVQIRVYGHASLEVDFFIDRVILTIDD